MTVGELFLESLSSGVITQAEIDWLLSQQEWFPRAEQAAMQRLGRLLDQGQIQLGCRLTSRWQQLGLPGLEPSGSQIKPGYLCGPVGAAMACRSFSAA